MHKIPEPVAILSELFGEAVDFAAVDGLEAAAGGVCEHFLGETAGQIGLAGEEHLLEGDNVRELVAVGKFCGGIDFGAAVGSVVCAPAADGVEVF